MTEAGWLACNDLKGKATLQGGRSNYERVSQF